MAEEQPTNTVPIAEPVRGEALAAAMNVTRAALYGQALSDAMNKGQ